MATIEGLDNLELVPLKVSELYIVGGNGSPLTDVQLTHLTSGEPTSMGMYLSTTDITIPSVSINIPKIDNKKIVALRMQKGVTAERDWDTSPKTCVWSVKGLSEGVEVFDAGDLTIQTQSGNLDLDLSHVDVSSADTLKLTCSYCSEDTDGNRYMISVPSAKGWSVADVPPALNTYKIYTKNEAGEIVLSQTSQESVGSTSTNNSLKEDVLSLAVQSEVDSVVAILNEGVSTARVDTFEQLPVLKTVGAEVVTKRVSTDEVYVTSQWRNTAVYLGSNMVDGDLTTTWTCAPEYADAIGEYCQFDISSLKRNNSILSVSCRTYTVTGAGSRAGYTATVQLVTSENEVTDVKSFETVNNTYEKVSFEGHDLSNVIAVRVACSGRTSSAARHFGFADVYFECNEITVDEDYRNKIYYVGTVESERLDKYAVGPNDEWTLIGPANAQSVDLSNYSTIVSVEEKIQASKTAIDDDIASTVEEVTVVVDTLRTDISTSAALNDVFVTDDVPAVWPSNVTKTGSVVVCKPSTTKQEVIDPSNVSASYIYNMYGSAKPPSDMVDGVAGTEWIAGNAASRSNSINQWCQIDIDGNLARTLATISAVTSTHETRNGFTVAVEAINHDDTRVSLGIFVTGNESIIDIDVVPGSTKDAKAIRLTVTNSVPATGTGTFGLIELKLYSTVVGTTEIYTYDSENDAPVLALTSPEAVASALEGANLQEDLVDTLATVKYVQSVVASDGKLNLTGSVSNMSELPTEAVATGAAYIIGEPPATSIVVWSGSKWITFGPASAPVLSLDNYTTLTQLDERVDTAELAHAEKVETFKNEVVEAIAGVRTSIEDAATMKDVIVVDTVPTTWPVGVAKTGSVVVYTMPVVEKLNMSEFTASSSSDGGYPASRAIDGNRNTGWSADTDGVKPSSVGEWLQLDADTDVIRSVTRVETHIYDATRSGYTVKIEAINQDDTKVELGTFVTKTSVMSESIIDRNLLVNAKAIRLTAVDSVDGNGYYSYTEIQLYSGTPGTYEVYTYDVETDAPVLSLSSAQGVASPLDGESLHSDVLSLSTTEYVQTSISGIKSVRIRGRVDTVDLLPTEGNTNGDIWFVGAADAEDREDYIWSEELGKFVLAGPVNMVEISLSDYSTIASVTEAVEASSVSTVESIGSVRTEIEDDLETLSIDTTAGISFKDLVVVNEKPATWPENVVKTGSVVVYTAPGMKLLEMGGLATTASSTYNRGGDYDPSYVLDGSNSTEWLANTLGARSLAVGQWYQVDVGSDFARSISKIETNIRSNGTRNGYTVKIEAIRMDDTAVELGTFVTRDNTISENLVNLKDVHDVKTIRFTAMSAVAGNGYYGFEEIRFFSSVLGKYEVYTYDIETDAPSLTTVSQEGIASVLGNSSLQEDINLIATMSYLNQVLDIPGGVHLVGRVDTVELLPTEGVKDGSLYLVGTEGSDKYDKYLYFVEVGRYEKVGPTNVQEVSLDDYTLTSTLTDMLTSVQTEEGANTDTLTTEMEATVGQLRQDVTVLIGKKTAAVVSEVPTEWPADMADDGYLWVVKEPQPWVAPTLTSNGVPYVDEYAVDSFSADGVTRHSWSSTTWKITNQNCGDWQYCWSYVGGVPFYVNMYFKNPTNITEITGRNRIHGSLRTTLYNYAIEVSDDDVNWETIHTGTNTSTGSGGIWPIAFENTGYYKNYRLKVVTKQQNQFDCCYIYPSKALSL